MKEKLDLLVKNAEEKAKEIKSEADYLNIKSLFLGKKSELSEYMAGIKDMSLEEKKEYGPLFNKVKKQLEELFSNSLDNALNGDSDKFDPTINRDVTYGSLHPVTIIFFIISLHDKLFYYFTLFLPFSQVNFQFNKI